jgi:hypothetical protein
MFQINMTTLNQLLMLGRFRSQALIPILCLLVSVLTARLSSFRTRAALQLRRGVHTLVAGERYTGDEVGSTAELGSDVELPEVGGLHQRYERRAA